jgi:hypothetical protein
VKPCNLFAVAGYDMFARKCSGGIHFLQRELPQGSVTGSCSGNEHCEHWTRRTISLASLEASRGRPLFSEDLLDNLDLRDRPEVGGTIEGGGEYPDMNGTATNGMPLDSCSSADALLSPDRVSASGASAGDCWSTKPASSW